MPRPPRSVRAALLVLSAAVAACGVGSPSEQLFVLGGIGPEGGTLEAGDVRLAVAPAALPQPTGVNIAPQATPLPIEPGPNDPCTYDFLGPIWCCGPVGTDLAVASYIRIRYDEGLLPAGVPETDLVLLLWDHAAGVLRPVTAGVNHDLAANLFETSQYLQLGHLAVGVRTCTTSPLDIVFSGVVPVPLRTAKAGVAQVAPDGLFLAASDGSVPVEPLPTEGDVPTRFVPSPDGSRVLYSVFLPSEDQLLRTLVVGAAAPVTVVDETRQLNGGDPLFGWMRRDGRVFFPEFLGSSMATVLGAFPATGNAVSTVSADGGAAPVPLYGFGSTAFLLDLRQSDDGSRLLLRLYDFIVDGDPERIEVVDAATALPLSIGVVPVGGGQQTPRFVPGSTDVYLVADDGRSVQRYEADGTPVGTIFALDAMDPSVLVDFVIAPDGAGYAAIYEDPFANQKPGVHATLGGNDTLECGTLAGGPVGSTDLGTAGASFAEMVFHPDGARVVLEGPTGVRLYAAADATPGSVLPVASLSDVDVHAGDGRLLLRVDSLRALGAGQALPPGIYVAPPDGTGLLPVDVGGRVVLGARWRTGLRATPGMDFVPQVR